MPSASPMVWREGKDLIMDCYFCRINLRGINCKNKHHVQYPDVTSAYSEHSDKTVVARDDAYKCRVSAFIKTLALWKSATKTGGI